MKNVLVIGGFTESKRLLEPVADAAVELGFGGDAETLTLLEARKMDEERLRQRLAGANVITHSAGVMAVPDLTKRASDSELPIKLTTIAGPEPRPKTQLVISAHKKTFDHLLGRTPHPREAHLKVIAGNTADLMAHPFANLAMVPAIGRFSTAGAIREGEVWARDISNLVMDEDVFFPNAVKPIFGTLIGKHDELLLNPKNVLRDAIQLSRHMGIGPDRSFSRRLR